MKRPLTSATVELFVGHKGMGKSAAAAAATAGAPRRFIWDVMREHDDVDFTVRSATECFALFSRLTNISASVRWLPGFSLRDEFENFCIAAMAWGSLMVGKESVSVVVEELAAVTGSAKAADLWGKTVRECRHWHLKIYATAQRTAEIDKTIVGGASRVVCFWMPLARDRERAAEDLSIPQSEFDALAARPLYYIESDGSGRFSRGLLRFA